MNLGIGVCFQDVSFTGRNYSTNVANPNKKTCERNSSTQNLRQRNADNESENEKEAKRVSVRCKYTQRHLNHKHPDFKGNESENQYSSTPTRKVSPCTKYDVEKQLDGIEKYVKDESKSGSPLDRDSSSRLQKTIPVQSTSLERDENITSHLPKSKWKLVAARLKTNVNRQSIKQAASHSDFNGQTKKNTLYGSLKERLSPNLNTSYLRQYRDPYCDTAQEIRTNPQQPPVNLLDPSYFYITASKFCTCDHHNQSRKIDKEKAAIARKTRRRYDRFKRKELRRKRRGGSLSLSRSSSESICSLGRFKGNGSNSECPLDILPSIPSLSVPSIDYCDDEEEDGHQCRISSSNVWYNEHENLHKSSQIQQNRDQHDDEASINIPKLSNNDVPPKSSDTKSTSTIASLLIASSLALTPVILDGCEPIINKKEINNKIATRKNNHNTARRLDTDEKKSKEDCDDSNWTLRSSDLQKQNKASETKENYAISRSSRGESKSVDDNLKIKSTSNDTLQQGQPQIHSDHFLQQSPESKKDALNRTPISTVSAAISPDPHTRLSASESFKQNHKEGSRIIFPHISPSKPASLFQKGKILDSRAWMNNYSPKYDNSYRFKSPHFRHYQVPRRLSPITSYPPNALQDFIHFHRHHKHQLPPSTQRYDSSNQNVLLKHYTASPSKRRNSVTFPANYKFPETNRHRRYSVSPSKNQHSVLNDQIKDFELPPHYFQQIQHVHRLQQMQEHIAKGSSNSKLYSSSVSLSISTSSLSDDSPSLTPTGSSKRPSDDKTQKIIENTTSKQHHQQHRPLSMEMSHNTYQQRNQILRQNFASSSQFLTPQLPQCIQNIILQHHWHLTRAPNLPEEATAKHLKKLSKHILLPDDPEDPAAFTVTPEFTRPPRTPWCSSKPTHKIVGTFALLMSLGILAAILYASYSSNIFKPMT